MKYIDYIIIIGFLYLIFGSKEKVKAAIFISWGIIGAAVIIKLAGS